MNSLLLNIYMKSSLQIRFEYEMCVRSLKFSHRVFPWSAAVGVLDWFTSSHSQCPEPRHQRRVILVWLEPITYFRLQPTCPGISWRSTRTSSHFSTGVCHLHISINWLEYRKRSADIRIESDSVQLKGWKWEHLLVRAGTSDENLRLVSLRNGTSGPLLWSKYLNKPSSPLVSCNL